MRFAGWLLLLAPWTAAAQQQPSRAEQETLLAEGVISNSRGLRVALDNGLIKHDATVEFADGSDAYLRNYKGNAAAYQLDKLLGLDMVVPSFLRQVNGRPASITWWADGILVDEMSRRKNQVAPPDPVAWARQMEAVRVFDELMDNAYRNTNPAEALTHAWDNLLITRDWRIRLIDHTRTFQLSRNLQDVQSPKQCDRSLLDTLRGLNRADFARALGDILSPEQIDALEARRVLLVRHFDQEIAARGAQAVLYQLHR